MPTGSSVQSFVLVADDVLAHMLFLPEAFSGPGACSWEGERAFLFDVVGAGQYLVVVDATEGGLGVAVHLFDPDLPAAVTPKNGLACIVFCEPAELLTMLAGGSAQLAPTEPAALAGLLGCMQFSGYGAFCERRHLRAWTPLADPGNKRSPPKLIPSAIEQASHCTSTATILTNPTFSCWSIWAEHLSLTPSF